MKRIQMTYQEMLVAMQGNSKQESARVVGMYQTVHDMCRRNGLGENDARMILERIHHDEQQDRQFGEQLKNEMAARGVKL